MKKNIGIYNGTIETEIHRIFEHYPIETVQIDCTLICDNCGGTEMMYRECKTGSVDNAIDSFVDELETEYNHGAISVKNVEYNGGYAILIEMTAYRVSKKMELDNFDEIVENELCVDEQRELYIDNHVREMVEKIYCGIQNSENKYCEINVEYTFCNIIQNLFDDIIFKSPDGELYPSSSENGDVYTTLYYMAMDEYNIKYGKTWQINMFDFAMECSVDFWFDGIVVYNVGCKTLYIPVSVDFE